MKEKKISEVGIFCDGMDAVMVRKTVTREWLDNFISNKLEFYDTAYDGAMKMLRELGIEVEP